MVKKSPVHKSDLVPSWAGPLGPIFPAAPEQQVLYLRWEQEHGQAISHIDRNNAFWDWYRQLETNVRIWAENVESGRDSYRNEHLHPLLERHMRSMSARCSIADIGIGPGSAIVPHLKRGQRYVGLDPSTYCLERAAERFGLSFDSSRRRIAFGALPAALPLDEQVDEAICSMVLHHTKDVKTAVDSILSILRPGGRYFIVTFDARKRADIDSCFTNVTCQDDRQTTGDFDLPAGKLTGLTIYHHPMRTIASRLRAQSDKLVIGDCAEIFRTYEGTKAV